VFTPASGSLVLHVLDGKLQAHPIAATELAVQAKAVGAAALVPVKLAGDKAPAQSSVFSGSDDALKNAASVDVIVRIELDGKAQRVVISTAKAAEHHEGDGHDHK
jgi:hypothetical protein